MLSCRAPPHLIVANCRFRFYVQTVIWPHLVPCRATFINQCDWLFEGPAVTQARRRYWAIHWTPNGWSLFAAHDRASSHLSPAENTYLDCEKCPIMHVQQKFCAIRIASFGRRRMGANSEDVLQKTTDNMASGAFNLSLSPMSCTHIPHPD